MGLLSAEDFDRITTLLVLEVAESRLAKDAG